jgi:excisionase family DNA binding protein
MADVSFLTIGEVAAALRTSQTTVLRAVRAGRLHAVEVAPRTKRIRSDEFEEFISKSGYCERVEG